VIDLEAALCEHFFQILIAQRMSQGPGDRLHDQPCLEIPSVKSSFDWRFSFSATAISTIGSLRNFRSSDFSSDGQNTVKRSNLRQARIFAEIIR